MKSTQNLSDKILSETESFLQALGTFALGFLKMLWRMLTGFWDGGWRLLYQKEVDGLSKSLLAITAAGLLVTAMYPEENGKSVSIAELFRRLPVALGLGLSVPHTFWSPVPFLLLVWLGSVLSRGILKRATAGKEDRQRFEDVFRYAIASGTSIVFMYVLIAAACRMLVVNGMFAPWSIWVVEKGPVVKLVQLLLLLPFVTLGTVAWNIVPKKRPRIDVMMVATGTGAIAAAVLLAILQVHLVTSALQNDPSVPSATQHVASTRSGFTFFIDQFSEVLLGFYLCAQNIDCSPAIKMLKLATSIWAGIGELRFIVWHFLTHTPSFLR